MTPDDARTRFAGARRVVLATGSRHLVPIVFAAAGDTIYTAVDQKPKRTRRLQRLRDIARDPAVSLLADGYDEDWSRLWWVRAEGTATVHDDHPQALRLLVERYPAQYGPEPPAGPFVAVAVTRWSGWSAAQPD